ncbi:hypothetical protein D3C86_980700 [compost metagenome]
MSIFDNYDSATPKERYEQLRDREFALNRYHWIMQSLTGDRAHAIRSLGDHLCQKGNFLTAPASSRKKYHLSEPGGLLRHSIWVSDTYMGLLKHYGVEMDETSARLVSLFHDCSKAGLGGIAPGDHYEPRYIETSGDERWRTGEEFKYNPDLAHLVLPVGSLWLVSSFVALTVKEAQCIVAHDGAYLLENRSYAHRLPPEATLLQHADESSLMFERELV